MSRSAWQELARAILKISQAVGGPGQPKPYGLPLLIRRFSSPFQKLTNTPLTLITIFSPSGLAMFYLGGQRRIAQKMCQG